MDTRFAALADTATLPSPRDSALAVTRLDSGRCYYIEGAFSLPEAMELAFGSYDPVTESSKWTCKAKELATFSGKLGREGVAYSRAADQFALRIKGKTKMLVLTETLGRARGSWESCHACVPILGAAMFTQLDSAWFLETLKKDIVELGAWGRAPRAEVVQVGPDALGLRFNYGYTAQGTSIGGMMLIGIFDTQFKVMADVHTNFSNEEMFLEGEGEGFKYRYSADVQWIAEDERKVYDMLVHTTGRRPSDGLDGTGPIRPFSETRTYVYREDHYVLWDSILSPL